MKKKQIHNLYTELVTNKFSFNTPCVNIYKYGVQRAQISNLFVLLIFLFIKNPFTYYHFSVISSHSNLLCDVFYTIYCFIVFIVLLNIFAVFFKAKFGITEATLSVLFRIDFSYISYLTVSVFFYKSFLYSRHSSDISLSLPVFQEHCSNLPTNIFPYQSNS